jgi:hypothetical protein
MDMLTNISVSNARLNVSGLWVGWPGIHMNEGDAIPESDPTDVSPTAGLKSSQVLVVNLVI